MASKDIPTGKRLVLFDGTCNFCNGAVLFIIDRDPTQQFVFAPIQSDVGERVLANMPERDPQLDSIVLVEGERISTHSTAALRVAVRLSGLWPLLGVLGYLFPRFIRDALYRGFARRRYVWFGKRETCRVPTPELRQRFLALS